MAQHQLIEAEYCFVVARYHKTKFWCTQDGFEVSEHAFQESFQATPFHSQGRYMIPCGVCTLHKGALSASGCE